GPAGLGSSPSDIWGCDFDPQRGDFGDADLTLALEAASELNKAPIAVVAGHMHHALKGGGERTWYLERNGVHYINAARVPRIYRENGEKRRHHIRIELDSSATKVESISW
ncbi:MAG: hypothetical protein KDK23_14555, partial [Leptospiraceae bacterium]|nr:hypothetical protein [Leptospiraceae bacterium]